MAFFMDQPTAYKAPAMEAVIIQAREAANKAFIPSRDNSDC